LNRRSQAKLYGAIRLVPDVDTIGIPLFVGGNGMFVPEMDADFRIIRFLDFLNDEGYVVDHNLPSHFQGRMFSIGSPTPLPFWYLGTSHFIEGDAESDDLISRFGKAASENPVLKDLGGLLNDARSGHFRRRREKWTADEIAAGFGDVFSEPPVHSRYWVRRYAVAVANARAICQPPHPIDIRLRRVALAWLQRFGSKTDFPRLLSILGKPQQGIITDKRLKDILFAFFVHKASSGNFYDVEKYVDHSFVLEVFPFGLNYYFERRREWPKVPFAYERPDSLVRLLASEIRQCNAARRFERAAKLTFLLYGRTQIPNYIDDITRPILNMQFNEFKQMRQAAGRIFADRRRKSEWSETAQKLLQQYDRLMVLDGILNGDARLSKVIVDRRFGVDTYYINELRKIASERD